MAQQFSEPVELLSSGGAVTMSFGNQSADATLGGDGHDGDIIIRDSSDRAAIHLNGNAAKIRLGTAGNEGDIAVQDDQGRDVFIVSGHYATCYLGAEGNEGDLFIRDSEGRNILTVNGHLAQVTLGIGGNPAQLRLTDDNGRFAFDFDTRNAALYVGTTDNEGDIRVRNNAGVDTIRLDGQSGDIELVGADCAEEFDIAVPEEAQPGTIMVIGPDGRLVPCSEGYDRRVAGVISGAGGYFPGVTLDKRKGDEGRRPLALVGKVFAFVDAAFGPVDLGDILTTSTTTGHAMRATDPGKAFGAVIGKALGRLDEGRGLVPMLIALQ